MEDRRPLLAESLDRQIVQHSRAERSTEDEQNRAVIWEPEEVARILSR
jgi:hypothetical protein